MSRNPTTALAASPSVVRIAPSHGWQALALPELWAHRELLYFLTWRDVKVRYKQTALGVVWAVLQPLLTLGIFVLVFGRAAGMASAGRPYWQFALAGLVPWTFVATSLGQSANSLVAGANLITKVYFPRLVLPLASVLAGGVDFVIALTTLAVMLAIGGVFPGTSLVLLPVSILLLAATAMGVGFWLSAANVRYRDVRYAVPFLTQIWLFASPVAYPRSELDDPWRTILGLNPVAGALEAFRAAVLGTPLDGGVVALSGAVSLVLLVTGTVYFRRMERSFADIV